MLLDRRLLSQFDWSLLAVTILLPLLGLVVLYSAGYDPDTSITALSWIPIELHSKAFVKQLLFLGFGLLLMLAALSIPPQVIYRYSYLAYGLCLISLAAVLIVGQSSHGSQRWLALGGINFQPSEMMKLCLILALARYLSKNPPPQGGYGFTDILLPFAIFVLPMILIIRQPDLGTSLCVGAIGFSMVLFMGIRIRSLVVMFVMLALAIFPFWHFLLKSYQKRRVLALFNPNADPLGSGYHIIQSKIAVGSGSVFGKGFLQGTQTQLEFLPEHTTDFVFSVLAEEWGFVGSILVLSAYFYLLYKILRVSMRSKDLFPALVAFGVAVLIFFHVVVNVGMVIGILPVVGLPLPLFSYGGSSIIVTMLLVGLALGVSMRRLTFVSRS